MLTKATSIKTYNQYLITHEGEVLENMAAWGGKKHFWEIIEVPPVHPLTQLQYKFQVDFKKIRDFFYHQDFEIVPTLCKKSENNGANNTCTAVSKGSNKKE